MRHLLMHPAFPDIVGAWARDEACKHVRCSTCSNDNDGEDSELNDPLLALVARAEIDATRLW